MLLLRMHFLWLDLRITSRLNSLWKVQPPLTSSSRYRGNPAASWNACCSTRRLRGRGLKVNSCEASCGLPTPTVCFDISHSDHNNRGHSSSAGVCQSEERGEAGREVSHPICLNTLREATPTRSLRSSATQRPGLWLPRASGSLSQINTQ